MPSRSAKLNCGESIVHFFRDVFLFVFYRFLKTIFLIQTKLLESIVFCPKNQEDRTSLVPRTVRIRCVISLYFVSVGLRDYGVCCVDMLCGTGAGKGSMVAFSDMTAGGYSFRMECHVRNWTYQGPPAVSYQKHLRPRPPRCKFFFNFLI